MDIYQATCYLGKQLFHKTKNKKTKNKKHLNKKTKQIKQNKAKNKLKKGLIFFLLIDEKIMIMFFFLIKYTFTDCTHLMCVCNSICGKR